MIKRDPLLNADDRSAVETGNAYFNWLDSSTSIIMELLQMMSIYHYHPTPFRQEQAIPALRRLSLLLLLTWWMYSSLSQSRNTVQLISWRIQVVAGCFADCVPLDFVINTIIIQIMTALLCSPPSRQGLRGPQGLRTATTLLEQRQMSSSYGIFLSLMNDYAFQLHPFTITIEEWSSSFCLHNTLLASSCRQEVQNQDRSWPRRCECTSFTSPFICS